MDDLTKIGIKYHTDKAYHHKYTTYYHNIFNKYRNSPIRFLEVGISKGPSMRMWNDYFNNIELVGIDINKASMMDDNWVKCYHLDSGTDNFSSNFNEEAFDIIIDDGSHRCDVQQKTLSNLFSYLKPGGIYIIEDMDWSFSPRIGSHGDISVIEKFTTYKVLENYTKTGNIYSPFIINNRYIEQNIDKIEYWWKEKELPLIKSRSCLVSIYKK